MNLASILLRNAVSRPHHPAIVDGHNTLDHETVAILAGRYAARLAGIGVVAGDFVGLALGDTPDHLILHYAVAWLGATIVPIDHRWTMPEKQAVTQAFACRFIVTSVDHPFAGVQHLVFDDSWRSDDRQQPPMVDREGLPIMLSLSSGTTGRPSGSLVSHRELYERWIGQWVGIGFNARDRFLLATPLYFGAGRSFGMSFLAAGGTVIFCPPPAKPQQLIDVSNRHGATVLFLVPTQIRGLVEVWSGAGLALPNVRLLVTSGSAIAAHERETVMTRLTPGFVDYYGTSEGGGISVLMPDEQLAFADTVGRPAFRVEIQIVDVEGKSVTAGAIGRLRYRGPGVSRQMVSAEGTHTLNAESWLEPGDLARLMPTGHVQLAGRAKDLIIRGGVNIYPAEIEAALRAHPAISELCVFGVADNRLGERIVAALVLKPGETADTEAIKSFAKGCLADYKIPDRYVVVAELPRNSSGKIIRSALAKL